ncbi:hypothetical protein BU16DRAFT_251832 [Lophium mytilinum]|uniref:Uncharacterized protein n=1 Tax=Lophium mytilinum TaxID=390894 RepID=A0A6A6RA10_9PEZI|nr:hypothetical protein BU16DRAFT_251832 [Lophium mytilinum]
MPSGQGAGTNPIHNKKPKKKPAAEEDEDDKAFKAKQQAEAFLVTYTLKLTRTITIDAKARQELASGLKGKKGPLNTGTQGIKKSGKKGGPA